MHSTSCMRPMQSAFYMRARLGHEEEIHSKEWENVRENCCWDIFRLVSLAG